MKDLLSNLKKEVYVFKDPWRASNRSLTFVVPIVATKPQERNYVVLEEVKDRVKIVDTGGIHQVRIEGDENRPTFMRGGTMLKGATQERATQFGIVVIPTKSEPIPVHCIHASRGIMPGAAFQASGMSPRKVYSTMLSDRNQSRTWSEVSRYSDTIRSSLRMDEFSFRNFAPPDDLAANVEAMQKFRTELKEILKSIPDYVSQVGTVIIDPDGIVGLEMYDHPDSWKAYSESIMRSFSDELAREDKTGIFKPDMTAVIPLIHKFLEEVEKTKQEEEVFKQNNAETVIIRIKECVGEYTILNGKTIHLLITRRNQPQEPMTDFASRFRPIERPRPTDQSPTHRLLNWGKRKTQRGNQVMTQLEDQPQTWTSLRSSVPMSKATLSNRLKEMQRSGVVEKRKGGNGVVRYGLTGIGHEMRETEKAMKDLFPLYSRSVHLPRSLRPVTCPKCHSKDVSFLSFEEQKTNYECNACHHKWVEPRLKDENVS
jgi:DNA-binding HxlR family transcriptional regulator